PFRQYWQRSDGKIERVHDELYASEAFNKAYEDLQRQEPEPGCTLERVVCGLMFWSDSTHLANFGDASLWPLYMYFGNLSKYVRCKPSTSACHHIAYIPKLPDTFHDFFVRHKKEPPTGDILTHCRRELMHAVWRYLLDEDFLMAYKHGIVIKCADGIIRRVYPRIFTYSADYPEKVLLATIRNLGTCGCPRCTIPKDLFEEMGMVRDDARRTKQARCDDHVYRSKMNRACELVNNEGYGVKSVAVENILSKDSYVPTKNAFSEKLSDLGFNLFTMLVVDLMHEFELGVWKATFMHLIRMLISVGGNVVQEFNSRYRQVPSFGRSTVRKFHTNVSSLKKLAARDYEDILQCAIPVFESLLPDPQHDKCIAELLFTLAEWHANAKLRMHTDSTLDILRSVTHTLGSKLRSLVKNICPSYDTKELPSEVTKRGRRLSRKRAQGQARQARQNERTAEASGSKPKLLNLATYKLHALGDYVWHILMFGTTDSYSTQIGELQHRRVKRFYARTNKHRTTRQIARLNERERALRGTGVGRKPSPTRKLNKYTKAELSVRARMQNRVHDLLFIPPEAHHFISESRNNPVHLSNWLHTKESKADAALKNHLLHRLRKPGQADDGTEYTSHDRSELTIKNDRIYRQRTFRVNYTTYDVRRDQDSMNPNRHADILMLSHDVDPSTGVSLSGHPFTYARILDIFQVPVVQWRPGTTPTENTIPVLFVRWYELDTHWRAGFQQKRLPRVRFLRADNPAAYGFVDPDEVIRGAHLIPAFAHGRTSDYLESGDSIARLDGDQDDWRFYYVNWFVDRDMYMRYRGGGIGHI
ncbi:hypothetical protein K474DRAFT_1576474, partial [Panus rudis PR-1116 ss-1]